ncbi:hypothetical protein AB0M79_09020 [Polymorphospora sp. NPDC051019]|uniref:hypothetical protein n=1 Tax=Polymorphospora sp. NPDC051019 TaxID=3155725 RepID=UPI003433D492
MRGTEPGSAREEAERLVATALAAARLAATGRTVGDALKPLGDALAGILEHPPPPTRPAGPAPEPHGPAGAAGEPRAAGTAGAPDGATAPGPTGGFATGGADCCVCPVCRGIAALRDPSPEFAERLATGAGDLAAGVASLLRAFATARPGSPAGADDDRPSGRPAPDDEVWRAAARDGDDSPAADRGTTARDTPAPGPRKPAAGRDDPAAGRDDPAQRGAGPGDEA